MKVAVSWLVLLIFVINVEHAKEDTSHDGFSQKDWPCSAPVCGECHPRVTLDQVE